MKNNIPAVRHLFNNLAQHSQFAAGQASKGRVGLAVFTISVSDLLFKNMSCNYTDQWGYLEHKLSKLHQIIFYIFLKFSCETFEILIGHSTHIPAHLNLCTYMIQESSLVLNAAVFF